MKTNYLINSLLGLLIIIMSGTASATLFDFNDSNLGVDEGAYDSLDMTVDGIRVDITAFTIENNSKTRLVSENTDEDIGVYFEFDSDGSLGVKSSSSGDARNMDGGNGSISDPDEGLLFSFDTVVSLDYIDFDGFDVRDGDDFNLTIDGVLALSDINDDNSPSLVSIFNNGDIKFDKYDFQGLVGKEFLFWADHSSDSFRIDEFRVAVIPVPASFLLFSTGLAWLGLRKTKS